MVHRLISFGARPITRGSDGNTTTSASPNNGTFPNSLWTGEFNLDYKYQEQAVDNGPMVLLPKAPTIYDHYNDTHTIQNIPAERVEKKHIEERALPNGLVVNVRRSTKTDGMYKDWADCQVYLRQAADEMGLTLSYVEVIRSAAVSRNKHRQNPHKYADAGESAHNFGCAVDITLYTKDGEQVPYKSEIRDQFAKRVIELSGGKVTWGGNFAGNGSIERHHFELTGWRELRDKGVLTLAP